MSESLLTVKQLSSFLDLHPNTIYKWKDQGKLPCVNINGKIRFEKAKIDEFIEKNKNKQTESSEPLPKLDISIQDHVRMFPKGGIGELKKKTRWNYGFGGVRLRKTKNGIEKFDIWINQNGKRKYKVVPNAQTREEAMTALESERRKAFANEYGLLQKPHVVKFSHLMDQYLENYAKINNRAWKRDRDCLKNMEAFFGDCYLKEITPFQIEKYKANRLNQGVKPNTVNRELSVLKRAFNLAIDWHMAGENPVRRVKFFQQPDPKERILSEREEQKLINASSEHLKPIIIAALNTGMRVAEILSLRWSQINLKKREIEVVKTKSGKKRVIPINPVLFEMFNRLERADEFVFLYHDPKTKKPRPVKSVKRSFTNSCRRAGIEAFTFHDTRHTFASRLVERGVDLITVKELLGHSSVRTTERYTHTHKEEKKRAVDVLVKEAVQAENLLTICESVKNAEIGKPFNLLITNN